jgi:betaine-aldehyde dehydrogenase
VKAARACLNSPEWGYASTGKQRAIILRKLGQIITSRKEELIRLDSLDQGKPIREAEADINDVITSCEYFACLAEERDTKQNEIIENGSGGDFVTRILLEPIGVIGAITPWNYPLLMGIWKVIKH